PSALPRRRRVCLALPEAREVEAWGEPTFRVRNQMFAMYASANSHHGAGCAAVWIKASANDQDLLVRSAPQRIFVPPYMGASGWVGVYLDGAVDWTGVEDVVRHGIRVV